MAKPTEELINKEKIEKEEKKSQVRNPETAEELEKRIAEKLANLSLEDLDELLQYEDDLVAERIALEKRRAEKQKRQEGKSQKQKKKAEKAEQGAKHEASAVSAENMDSTEKTEGTTEQEAPFIEDKSNLGVLLPPRKRKKIGPRTQIKESNLPKKVKLFLFSILDKIVKFCKENPERAADIRRRFRIRKFKLISAKRRFWRREREMGTKMSNLVSNVDARNNEIAEKGAAAVETGTKKFNFAREWADLNKVLLLKYLSVVVILAIIGVAIFSNTTAFEYSYNGKTLGLVNNQEDVWKLADLVSQQLTKRYGAEVKIDPDKDISFKRVLSVGEEIDDAEDVLNKITYMQDLSVSAYAIYVDGTKIAIVDTEDTANAILDKVKSDYVSQNPANYLSVGFAENVEIKQISTKLGKIMDSDEVTEKILTGGQSKRIHTVAAGETFSEIASEYGISQSALSEMNPDVEPAKLSIGQELVLKETVPLLTVQTLELSNYIEYIPFETVYENDDTMYKGDSKTIVEGVDGERAVSSKIVKNNGETMANLELSSVVNSQPVTQVVHVGTKEKPVTAASGKFKYPVSGYTLTSKFGYRWGRMHYGVDLACSTGTPIKASDGGTVIFSGYSGSYGNVVKISHGNGYVTIYAHCSKLLVSKGEKVYQGQHIANVGSTGRSTGPHCHFEIQINGVAVNPLKYL